MTHNVINPATEAIVETIAWGTAADAHRAVDQAIAAWPAWRNTNAWQRADILKKIADLMRSRARELAAVTTAESGKPLAEAIGEWTVAAQFFEWYAEEGKRSGGEVLPASRNNKRMMVIHQPIGVVGIITAWNFPVWNLARVWAASLAAGCVMVAKPSEYTPLTALRLLDLLREAGLPEHAAQVVLADAAAIGDVLLDRPEIRKIHFVGSTRVGRILQDGAARTGTRLSLELGGNAPCIVMQDVDVEILARSAAIAKTRNCGQVCVAPQRFLVQRAVYDSFVDAVGHRMAALKVGAGDQSDTQVGPLINARQRDTVARIVDETVAQGARLVCGGTTMYDKGFFYAPTVLADVSPAMAAFRQELFGPVMSITPFDTEQEAITLANDTEYGLAAYLWTKDLGTSIRVSEALEFGIVGINEWNAHAIEAPFGGWKQSGQGYECGSEGLHEYLEKKLISTGI
jgi:acyl-CoA reductase-like NAD-dependent aldehyde dehydrogenase